MRLTDLEPQFLKREPRGGGEVHVHVSDVDLADGVMFLCPACYRANGGPVGTHSVICWRPSVPPDVDPKPGRWELVGTGYGDLSLVAGSSSIALRGGCCAHFFVRGGEVVHA